MPILCTDFGKFQFCIFGNNKAIIRKKFTVSLPCVHTPQTFGANLLSLEENTTIQLQCYSIYDHFISLHHYELMNILLSIFNINITW